MNRVCQNMCVIEQLCQRQENYEFQTTLSSIVRHFLTTKRKYERDKKEMLVCQERRKKRQKQTRSRWKRNNRQSYSSLFFLEQDKDRAQVTADKEGDWLLHQLKCAHCPTLTENQPATYFTFNLFFTMLTLPLVLFFT